jgi:hypothetical protein
MICDSPVARPERCVASTSRVPRLHPNGIGIFFFWFNTGIGELGHLEVQGCPRTKTACQSPPGWARTGLAASSSPSEPHGHQIDYHVTDSTHSAHPEGHPRNISQHEYSTNVLSCQVWMKAWPALLESREGDVRARGHTAREQRFGNVGWQMNRSLRRGHLAGGGLAQWVVCGKSASFWFLRSWSLSPVTGDGEEA